MSARGGWRLSTLGEIGTVIRGVTYKRKDAISQPAEGYIPLLRATNINESLHFEDLVYAPAEYVKPDQMLREGDIVIAASSGSKRVVGKAAQLTEPWEGSFGAFCFVLRPRRDVHPAYVFHFLSTPEYRSRISALSAGVNINNIKRDHLETMQIPLAPLPEQQAVVDEIEKHLTRIDVGAGQLLRAQGKLYTYRSMVLEQAVTGRLLDSQGGSAWRTATLGDCSEIRSGIQKQPSRKPRENHFPFLRVANVRRGSLDLTEVHRIELFGGELEKLRLQPGDLLVVEGNGSRDQIGRMAIWDGSIRDCVHQNHIIRARPKSEVIPTWIELCWNSPSGQRAVMDVASSTSGLYTLSAGKVSRLPFPVPPLTEQKAITAEVQRRLSILGELERSIVSSVKRAGTTRRNILREAFAEKK